MFRICLLASRLTTWRPDGMASLCTVISTVKICALFVQFKSYYLKFRRQYKLLCCLLVKLKAFLWNCEIGVYSAAIFRKVLYREWPPLVLSLLFWCFAWNPSIEDVFVCFTEEENSHDSKPSLWLAQYAIPLSKLEVLPSFRVGQ